MSGFAFHPAALTDPADSPNSAIRILNEIEETIRKLASFPQAGHLRPDLTSRPIRFHTVREYVIAYAFDEIPLTVLAVVHGRRHPRIISSLLRSRE